MRKWCMALLMLALLTPAASAETELTGAIVAGRTFVVQAAYGGTVAAVSASEGDWLAGGEALLTLSGEAVYAPLEGTVAAVYAAQGDDASAMTQRYGAAIAVEPKQKFTVYMTAEEEYRADDSQRIALGETLYLRCKADGSHRGVGIVTSVENLTCTIQCTGGQFSHGEVVYAGRTEDFAKSQRVGIGTVVAAETQSIVADGTVVNCYVSAGDWVEAGQLLLETASGTPCGADWNGGAVSAGAEGIVVSLSVQPGERVSQGQVVAVLADPEDLRVMVSLSEADLSQIAVGDAVSVRLADEREVSGSVESIAYAQDENGMYQAEIQLSEPLADAKLGQSVAVELPAAEQGDACAKSGAAKAPSERRAQ